MPEHVRRDENVLRQTIARCQVGVPGIAGEDHLEEP